MQHVIPGLYGKVPAHGDFIDRQLPHEFIRRWDEWLQCCVANSKERLAEDWLTIYLTSPIWRFVINPGAIDQHCWGGILVPSVDSVGRYFPLTLAQSLPATTSLACFYQQNQCWYQALESVALTALQDGINAEEISALLANIAAPLINKKSVIYGVNLAAQCSTLESALAAQLDSQLAQQYSCASLWSSVFTEPQQNNVLITQAMPTADQYTAMIDNQWQAWGWEAVTLLDCE